ncbi:hypothetical protein VDG1235_3332 [Verrucomicrobiia bacterium DG1235]|nr:hypothetical protein VDG1235_3332 [Verrucomicrobiae bacterium DG1235]
MKLAKLLLVAVIALSASFAYPKAFTDGLSEEEFVAAGLSKLTAEELSLLNELLERQADKPAAPPAEYQQTVPNPPPAVKTATADDLLGKEQVAIDTTRAPKKIESRLVGRFTGWQGSTIFTLENGQVWQQRIDEKQKYTPSESPEVTVYKSMGGYRIRFKGYNQSCPVKRIK